MPTFLSEIPEGGTFRVAERHIVGDPETFDRGCCRTTLIPDQVYLLEQSMVGLVIVEGVCHIEQRNERFGDVDEKEWKSLTIDTIDSDFLVIPTQG